MNNKILISIKPVYVKRILDGVKKYEYRRVAPKHNISTILIYETFPLKKVVAEVEVLGLMKYGPKELWDLTKENSGISKKHFFEYFKGKNIAYAFKLGKVTKFEKPISLEEFKIKVAPQSFVYL